MQSIAEKFEFSAIILHGDANENGSVRWFSNFEPLVGSTFIVIPAEGDPVLISDSVLHGEPMHSLWWTTWIHELKRSKFGISNMLSTLGEVLDEKHLISNDGKNSSIGYACDYGVTIFQIKEALGNIPVLDCTDLVQKVKMQKSVEEIELMRKTTKIAALSVKEGCELIRPDVKESSIAAAINGRMMEEGAQDVAFYTMVLSGRRTRLKHSPPIDRKMRSGEMVFIDAGCSVWGYFSDLCRTLTVGTPSSEQKHALTAVEEAHNKSANLISATAKMSEVVEEARSIISEFGLKREFHIDGHGIGTSMFDPPQINLSSAQGFSPKTAIAYEPSIFSKKLGTISLEDDYLVASNGNERLTSLCPQEFW